MKRKNLQKLATYLAYAPAPKGVKFDMSNFTDLPYAREFAEVKCGTAGCAVGWAPFAGIKKRIGESWLTYSERVLIDYHSHINFWEWCFGGDWAEFDNTRKGAAKRIQYLLDNGKPPEGFNSDSRGYSAFKKFYRNIVVKQEAK